MARPRQDGLTYFSHDCSMFDDDKVAILVEKVGIIGYAAYNYFLEKIYKSGGTFRIESPEEWKLHSKRLRVTVKKLEEVVNCLIEKGLIDKEFSSNGIRKRLDQVETERQRNIDRYKKKKEHSLTDISPTFHQDFTDISQNKVKERKEKEMKVNENKGNERKEKEEVISVPDPDLKTLPPDPIPEKEKPDYDSMTDEQVKQHIKQEFEKPWIDSQMKKFKFIEQDIIQAFKDLAKKNGHYKWKDRKESLLIFAHQCKKNRVNEGTVSSIAESIASQKTIRES